MCRALKADRRRQRAANGFAVADDASRELRERRGELQVHEHRRHGGGRSGVEVKAVRPVAELDDLVMDDRARRIAQRDASQPALRARGELRMHEDLERVGGRRG